MKVNIGTLEITDEQLYGIGLADGSFRKATRNEVKDKLLFLVTSYLEGAASPVAELTKKFALVNSDDGDSSTG